MRAIRACCHELVPLPPSPVLWRYGGKDSPLLFPISPLQPPLSPLASPWPPWPVHYCGCCPLLSTYLHHSPPEGYSGACAWTSRDTALLYPRSSAVGCWSAAIVTSWHQLRYSLSIESKTFQIRRTVLFKLPWSILREVSHRSRRIRMEGNAEKHIAPRMLAAHLPGAAARRTKSHVNIPTNRVADPSQFWEILS